MGRPKEPIRLIDAKGKSHHLTKAVRKERERSELHPADDRVEAPSFLTTKVQKRRFQEIADELLNLKIMTNLDCETLGRYVIAECDYEEYCKEIRVLRRRVKEKIRNGENEEAEILSGILSKYEGFKNKSFTQCHTIASAMGLTILSRCRIAVPKQQEEKPKNKFSEFIS